MPAPKLNPGPPIPPDPPLNWGGRILLGLVFAIGVALSIYGGFVAGLIVGVGLGAEAADNTPRQNAGMAPDLTPEINAVGAFATSTLVGAGLGLVVGAFVMWAACRFVLAPLFRRVPSLTTEPTAAVT